MGIEHATGGNGPLTFIANYTVVPMQKGISYMGMWISDVSSNFETMEDMQKKNDELQKKVDDLTIDNTRLRQDQYELERLRELYKLDENYSDYQKVGAHVISNNGQTGSMPLLLIKAVMTESKKTVMFWQAVVWQVL